MKVENENQRHELDAMKAFIVKEMKLKYRGCNHPKKVISSLGYTEDVNDKAYNAMIKFHMTS